MRKIIAPLLIAGLLFFIISNVSSTFASPGYHYSVFTPNGVSYELELSFYSEEKNLTTSQIIESQQIILSMNFSLSSKRMDLNHMAWGMTISINLELYVNGTLRESESRSLPMPPLFAIREGTRKIYLTTFLVSLLRQGMESVNISEITSNLAANRPYPGFYIYNPFYTPLDVAENDEIPYGYWNETANEGVIINGTVARSTTLSILGEEINTWVVEIRRAELLNMLSMLIGEVEIPEDADISMAFYYEKNTGWLVQGELEGEYTHIEGDTERTMEVGGSLYITNFGSIAIGGKSYLNRVLGLPQYTIEVLDIILIIGIIIIHIRRR